MARFKADIPKQFGFLKRMVIAIGRPDRFHTGEKPLARRTVPARRLASDQDSRLCLGGRPDLSRRYHGDIRPGGHRILRIGGVDLDRVSEVPDTNLALGQLVDQVQGVTDRPTEAVERVHDDHVALARERDDLSEPRPARCRAGLLVDLDPVARDPSLFERVDLPIEVLLDRRDARVP